MMICEVLKPSIKERSLAIRQKDKSNAFQFPYQLFLFTIV